MNDDVYNSDLSNGPLRNSYFKKISICISIFLHLLILLFIITIARQNVVKANRPVEVDFSGGIGKSSSANKIVSKGIVRTKLSNPVPVNSEQKSAPIGEGKKNSAIKDTSDLESQSGQNGTGIGSGNSGNGNVAGDFYYVAVDQMPVPIGGMQSIYARMNIDQPASGKSTIYLEAFIDENGIVKKCILIKGIGSKLDDTAVRVITQTKFQPGVLNGKRVKVQLYISIYVPGN
jgi:Gram-negative bacterial TonB protein C-terminal